MAPHAAQGDHDGDLLIRVADGYRVGDHRGRIERAGGEPNARP
jgi:hypothetical protein